MALGNLTDVKLGGAQVSKIYLGSNLVWQKATEEDADYLAFINAAVITDSTQKSAVSYLVTELKIKGLWAKMIAIYPFVGGNANAHKFNLKNPQDSDAAFRLVFSSVTHTANGVQNGYSNTNINPTNVNPNSFSGGFYSLTDSASGGHDISASSLGANNRLVIHSRFTDNNAYFDMFNASTERITKSAIGNSLGLYIASIINSNVFKAYKGGVLLGTNTNTRTNMFTGNICIGGLTGGPTTYNTSRNYAFAFFGNGLNDTEVVDFNNIVQQYQTILGRNV